jgi:hypothetical protein
MNKYSFLLALGLWCSITPIAAQNNQNSLGRTRQYNGKVIAQQIAMRMKDSLGLTGSQRHQLFLINVQLHERKMTVRNQTSADSINVLQHKLQKVENTRDSLYKPILGIDKFLLYRQKKLNLLQVN